MELLTVALAIFSIAEKVLNLRDKLSSNNKLSEWLHSTGDLLSSVSKGLRENRYPHDKCAQLKYTLENVTASLKPYLNEQEISEFYSLIETAYQVERLFSEISSLTDSDKELNICKIEDAVGKFYAAANFAKLDN